MNLHQLTVFRAVVNTGSFSKAATELRLAQSAVSYHIKALEGEIGAPLFSRLKTKIFLTEKGNRLREHTEKIFQAVAEAERELCHQRGAAELLFGLGVSSLSEQLPAYVKHLQEIHPGVRFQLAMGSTPRIIELLRTGGANLGVISLPIHDADIRTITLFSEEEEMLVVTPTSSPLGACEEISPHMLRGLPLILYNKSTATRASLDQFFESAGITPTVLMEVEREDTIMALVRSGLGATILPRCFLNTQQMDSSVRFLRLRNAYLRRQVGVALPGNRECSKLVDFAIQLCQQHFHGAATVPATSV
jgi:DNA-binding transcriptional LysR family regulator